ncbi:MAG: MATE family efflux transporter, partial [Spirochaetia bacterium]
VTIAFNWDIVSFVPMLGMGHAVTALVGQNVGAKDFDEARRSAFTGLKVSWIYSGTMVLVFIIGARALAGVFVSGMGGETQAVTALSVIMLRLAAFYLLADASQLVLTGALRGAGDTKWVMRASVILHWIFSVIAVILIKVVKADPVAVWLFFIAFVIGLGFTMYFRFRSGKWTRIQLINRDQ